MKIDEELNLYRTEINNFVRKRQIILLCIKHKSEENINLSIQ